MLTFQSLSDVPDGSRQRVAQQHFSAGKRLPQMNNPEHMERSMAEYILFGTAFAGFIIGVIGLVATSIPAALTGAVLFGVALSYWLLMADEEPI
jgi:preprotein translocase subunit SecY